MGVHPNIGFDKFPQQDKDASFGGVGARVTVCFNYDSTRTIGAEVMRADTEEPGLTIFRLDDGRHVMSHECMWTPRARDKHAPEHGCIACPVEVRDLSAVLHNLIVQLKRETALEPRSLRKLRDAEESLARFKPILDAHFAAINGTPKEQG